MNDVLALIAWLLILGFLLAAIVLPIVALVVSVRTRKKLKQAVARIGSLQPGESTSPPTSLAGMVQQLTIRVARLEDALSGELARPSAPSGEPEPEPRVSPPIPPQPPPPVAQIPRPSPSISAAPPMPSPIRTRPIDAERLESIVGRRWLGWAAVVLILLATAFFLKYAFDNRWIGELGRVAIGVAAGIALTTAGYRYHARKWRVFSQILTGGGVVLLYLTAYASFGYYHLATQKAAFIYMAILIAEAAGLALLYDAPAIAVMALLGGFLVPVLLRSDRDQYCALFSYIAAIDLGALVLLKRWWSLSSIGFFGTHLLFWLWYGDSFHPRKLFAVMIFQTAVFLIFLLSNLGRRLFRRQEVDFDDLDSLVTTPLRLITNFEDFSLLLVNPFVYFATAYFFLNPNHHEWMGAYAIGMAIVYAGAAKLLLDRRATTRIELLMMIGVALAFVTLAVPIQLRSNWITMAWAVEGLLMLWAGLQLRSQRLHAVAHALFALALLRLVFWDTPWSHRPPFTPVLNKYFLSSLFVFVCLLGAVLVYRRLVTDKYKTARVLELIIAIVALITLWFLMTVETNTYFAARAALGKMAGAYQHERWLGQMALSVMWSIYAALLMVVGFLRRAAAIRWVALSLFAVTIIKVMMVDIAVLQQLYRIIAFLVLGLLLLVVAWGYHKVFHSREAKASAS